MKGSMKSLLLTALAIGCWGCSPTMIQNSQVEATPENMEVWNQVEEYRVSMEERDADTVATILHGLIGRVERMATHDRKVCVCGDTMSGSKHVPSLADAPSRC